MILVSVYRNEVHPEPGNAEYVKAFADGTSVEAIAAELFNHAESDPAVAFLTDPAAIYANLITTVDLAMKAPPGMAVSINAGRLLVADSCAVSGTW